MVIVLYLGLTSIEGEEIILSPGNLDNYPYLVWSWVVEENMLNTTYYKSIILNYFLNTHAFIYR